MTAYELPGQHVLEEDYDEDYEPTEEEVLEYCKVLDLDPVAERELLYIAREGIKAPLPKDWKPVEDASGNIYYFNFVTGGSTWEHPCDEYYREQLSQERSKRMMKHRKTAEPRPYRPTRGGAAPLGALPQSLASPGRQLPPLKGAGLGGGRGLPAISSLPPLRTTPASLAPLQVPSAMSGTGSSLAGSMSSTGGGGRLADRVGKGGIDLGNMAISNKFEEEDTETEDSDLQLGFKSNFGDINLLDDADLGIQESSEEDVNVELRKVLELDEETSVEEPERPPAPDPASSPQLLLLSEPSPQSSPRVGRPGAARGERGHSKQPLQQQQPARPAHAAGEPDALKTSSDQRIQEVHTLEQDHASAVKKLNEQHAQELQELRQAFSAELESERAALHTGSEEQLAVLRRTLAAEQRAEEQRLRSEKAVAVEAVRRRVREEEEEEEARLEEAKTDTLRKIRQQHSQEQDREEKRLKEAAEAAIRDLRKKLQEEQVLEEANVRAASARQLSTLGDELAVELEEQRRELSVEQERKLEAVRQQWEAQVEGKRSEVVEQQEKELEALAVELRRQHEKAVEGMTRDSAHSLEEVKLRTEQSHKQAEQKMIAEFAVALEGRRGQLESQSQTELELLRGQLSSELARFRQEEGSKVEQERDKLSSELQHMRDALKEDHESKLQQLQTEFELSQSHFQQQHESQAAELAALEAGFAVRRMELEVRAREVEARRSRLEEEEQRLQGLHTASSSSHEAKQQSSQLQETIEKEKRTLHTLKKSRMSLEAELQQLEKQRNTVRSSLEAPTKTRPTLQKDKIPLKRQKHEKRKASRETPQVLDGAALSDVPQKPSSTPALTTGPVRKLGLAVEDIEEEEGDTDDALTSSSMQLQELNATQATLKGSAVGGGGGETAGIGVVSQGTREGFPGNLELPHHRQEHTQEALQKQLRRRQHSVKARRSALRQAQKEWKDDMKTFKRGHAHFSEDNNLSLMKEIRLKLQQEAAALGELEQKMKSSHHLLAVQEQSLKSMEAAETESTSHEDSDDQLSPSSQSHSLDDTAAARTYLSKLKARLEKTRRHTTPPHRRHFTSPSAAPPPFSSSSSSRVAAAADLRSQGSSSESSSDTTTTTIEVVPHRSTLVLSPTTRHLVGSERALSSPPPAALGGHAGSSGHREEQSTSLVQISHRLAQLLDRLEQPSQPAMPLLLSGGAALHTSNTSAVRWVSPAVAGGSKAEPTPQLTFGPRSKAVPPVLDPPHLRLDVLPARANTRQQMHSHTDWLKEFQQSASRLGCRSVAPGHGNGDVQLPASTVPRTRLTLDHHDNIQLVNV